MEVQFTNIEQGLLIFYTTVIIVASLAYISARFSESSQSSRNHRSK